jgi:hypothetical protein
MVDDVVVGEGTEPGLDFKDHFLAIRPQLLVVTEDDKYAEAKRQLCDQVRCLAVCADGWLHCSGRLKPPAAPACTRPAWLTNTTAPHDWLPHRWGPGTWCCPKTWTMHPPAQRRFWQTSAHPAAAHSASTLAAVSQEGPVRPAGAASACSFGPVAVPQCRASG